MPELPEVETVFRLLETTLKGEVIARAGFFSRYVTQGNFDQVSAAVRGARIDGLRRIGKHIFVQLDRGTLHIHLGMTGKLLWNAQPGPYTRAILTLQKGTLVFDDIRQFGRFNHYLELPPHLEAIGPDALLVSFEEFQSLLGRHKVAIKSFLLNQRIISGVGNIYADEALYRARLHPRTSTKRIAARRARALFDAIRTVLTQAIENRGSSISDYVDSNGAAGSFQNLHQVYGKEGVSCPTCRTPIKRIVVAQRGTHYCPKCQRA